MDWRVCWSWRFQESGIFSQIAQTGGKSIPFFTGSLEGRREFRFLNLPDDSLQNLLERKKTAE